LPFTQNEALLMFEDIYDSALKKMEATVHALSKCVPPPQLVTINGAVAYRYVEKTLHQALVQKLTRYVSGLHAARLLIESGFIQEQAALQRILDEIQEDIAFLSYSVIFNDKTILHAEYLSAFYEEEFDSPDPVASTQKRAPVRRKKIHAYLAKYSNNPSRTVELARTLSKIYSGYIHAASPHIMDLYWGEPAKFHMSGMPNTIRQDDHREDLWNCFYRGILAFAEATKAFGEDEMFFSIREFAASFAKYAGKDY
jgi:hypothetical protein